MTIERDDIEDESICPSEQLSVMIRINRFLIFLIFLKIYILVNYYFIYLTTTRNQKPTKNKEFDINEGKQNASKLALKSFIFNFI